MTDEAKQADAALNAAWNENYHHLRFGDKERFARGIWSAALAYAEKHRRPIPQQLETVKKIHEFLNPAAPPAAASGETLWTEQTVRDVQAAGRSRVIRNPEAVASDIRTLCADWLTLKSQRDAAVREAGELAKALEQIAVYPKPPACGWLNCTECPDLARAALASRRNGE